MFCDEMPTEVGLYKVKCMESDYKDTYVAITEEPCGLMVHCEDIGVHFLSHYHENLTDIEWLKIC